VRREQRRVDIVLHLGEAERQAPFLDARDAPLAVAMRENPNGFEGVVDRLVALQDLF